MVECPLCNYTDICLIEHLKEEHNLSIDEFRAEYTQLIADTQFYDFISKDLTTQRKGDRTSDRFLLIEDIKLEKLAKDSNRAYIPEFDPDYEFHKEAKWAAIAIKEKKNVFLTGFPGTGKSSLVLQLYARLNRSLYHISAYGDLSYENLIYKEEIKTNPDTGNIETKKVYGMIIQSMLDEKNKAGLLFDEISFADPRVLQVLQPLLESSTRYITIPETSEMIKAHSDWIFFATDNTRGQGDELGMFNGTENMNFALLNRFPFFLELQYLDPVVEKKILKSKLMRQGVSLPDDIYDKVLKITRIIRNGVRDGQYYMTFSMRDLFEWLLKLKYFDNPYQNLITCAQVTFLNKLNPDLRIAIENIMKNVLG